MVGSEDGQYDLEVRGVTPEDAGQYQCQVLASPGSPPLRSRLCTLIGPDTVLSLVQILSSHWLKELLRHSSAEASSLTPK